MKFYFLFHRLPEGFAQYTVYTLLHRRYPSPTAGACCFAQNHPFPPRVLGSPFACAYILGKYRTYVSGFPEHGGERGPVGESNPWKSCFGPYFIPKDQSWVSIQLFICYND